MLQLIATDREYLNNRNKAAFVDWSVSGVHFKDLDLYLEFSGRLVNNTIFDLAVSALRDSAVTWKNKPFLGALRIGHNKPATFKRGDGGTLSIEEDVLPDTAKQILATHDAKYAVRFKLDLHIPIAAYQPDGMLVWQLICRKHQ
jgi:hypothetical protein